MVITIYCINTSGSYYTELGPLTVKLSHFTQQIKFDKAARRISSYPSIMFGCIRTIISLYCYYNTEFYHSSKIIEQLSVECIKLTDLRNLKICWQLKNPDGASNQHKDTDPTPAIDMSGANLRFNICIQYNVRLDWIKN